MRRSVSAKYVHASRCSEYLLSHALPPSTHLIRTAPRATNPPAAVRVCVACRRCGSHLATHLASVTAMSTHRITPCLTRRALFCRRALTPLARHEALYCGADTAPLHVQCSCPHDLSNKCANGHNRRFGGVILALPPLCAVTKCRGRAHTVLDRMSGGCATAQATQRSWRSCRFPPRVAR